MRKQKENNDAKPPKPAIIRKQAELKRFLFFCTNFIIAMSVTLLMADLFWRIGFNTLYVTILVIFFILTWQITLGITHSIFGFFSHPRRGKFDHITETINYSNEKIPLASTAILIPIYNEDTQRVYEGIRAIFLSLKKYGTIEHFDFFILSDSTNVNKWIMEESLWVKLCQQLDAFGRIYYRRRENNFHKKAGNVADFCKSWGSRYRYMICLDADSLMSGETITSLVKIMEKNPGIGICQTAPKIVNGNTVFSRMIQFCTHFYGPLFQAGLNYWQQGKGNYWGHNAIIRIIPFMEYCALPRLPGKEPMGGKILSHDFVEAALMQKAGWSVWMAHNLDGSFEETPHNLIEFAIRDRRWCQGNLQHTWMLLSKGIPWANKIHFFNGIMSYFSSFLWFIFLILSSVAVYQAHVENLSLVIVGSFADFINISISQEFFLIFVITMSIILLPKFLSYLRYAVFYRSEFLKYGGIKKSFQSMLLEILLSAMIAPILMLFHSKFVVYTLLGKGVTWSTQNRNAEDGITIRAAMSAHGTQTAIGLTWAIAAYYCSPAFFWWFTPISISLFLSIPLSIIISKKSIGKNLLNHKIFLTPPETVSTEDLETLNKSIEHNLLEINYEQFSAPHYGITYGIVDPYCNALHAILLYGRQGKNIEDKIREPEFGEKLLKDGAKALTDEQIKLVLSDPSGIRWLHQQVWLRPSSELHDTWQKAIVSIKY